MMYDPERHHRRSIRLQGYDYSQAGAYFLTIVTQDRACLLGEVVDGEMRLNDVGDMVHQEWTNLPNRFPNIELDAFIVMPNHIHGIIVITDATPVGAGLVPAQHDDAAITSGATTRVAPTDAQNGDRATTPGAITSGATTRVAPTDAQNGDGATTPGAITPGATTPGATTRVAPTVGGIVGAFKSITTVRYIHGVKHYGWLPFRGRLWQRNYYEHIICNEESLNRIRQYILDNPLCWSFDRENPATTAPEPEDA
jgi:REP element-mobilizing transposase RayT